MYRYGCDTIETKDLYDNIKSGKWAIKVIKQSLEGVEQEVFENDKFMQDLSNLANAGMFSSIIVWNVESVTPKDYVIITADMPSNIAKTEIEIILQQTNVA